MQKSLIFKDNKDKSFVYRWINKVNNKEYLGSTANAKRRLLKYYDLSSLKLANMPIYKAILKRGHSNFIFEIIEYCEPDMVLEREQYYLDNFDFYYNVLEKADSILGYKHTEETLSKMIGRTNALGYKHNLETIAKLKELSTNKTHSSEAKDKMKEIWAQRKLSKQISSESPLETSLSALECTETLPDLESLLKQDLGALRLRSLLRPEGEQTNDKPGRKKIKGKIVVVTNIETNLTKEYDSISEAAIALNLTRNTLRNYIKNQTNFKLLRQDTSGIVTEKLLISIKQ